jgi:hypothetical protein
MEAQYSQQIEIAPSVVKIPKPIVDDAVDRSTQVQLVPEGIELNSEVDILRREGGFVDVERMGALVSGHGLVDDGIKVDRAPTDVDGHQSARREGPTQRGGLRRTVGHGLIA